MQTEDTRIKSYRHSHPELKFRTSLTVFVRHLMYNFFNRLVECLGRSHGPGPGPGPGPGLGPGPGQGDSRSVNYLFVGSILWQLDLGTWAWLAWLAGFAEIRPGEPAGCTRGNRGERRDQRRPLPHPPTSYPAHLPRLAPLCWLEHTHCSQANCYPMQLYHRLAIIGVESRASAFCYFATFRLSDTFDAITRVDARAS